MQKAFLVSNKATQVREYLEHRSIIEITEEHRSLTELDLTHLGIIDVNKVIYLYYASDDGDLAFRSDLNVLRQLLNSAFFHTDEGMFILIDCKNPMLEDLINSACRDSNLQGGALTIIHHTGVLTFSDVSKYIAGIVVGEQTASSYKSVYVREADTEERERYESQAADGLTAVLPVLTDQYAMYKKRSDVEAISAGRIVTDVSRRPQMLQKFAKIVTPTVNQWSAFLVSGERYSKFEESALYLSDYTTRVGLRTLVVNLSRNPLTFVAKGAAIVQLKDLMTRRSFAEKVGYLECRFNQFGFVVEMLDNVEGINSHIFVCDKEDFGVMQELLEPLCRVLYSEFITHYDEDSVKEYLEMGVHATTVFLSTAISFNEFSLPPYKEAFNGTRVAAFPLTDVDTTDFYECATGGVAVGRTGDN